MAMRTHSGCNALKGQQARMDQQCMQPCALHTSKTCTSRLAWNAARKKSSVLVRTASLETAPAATSSSEAISTVEDLRALMFKQGWHRAWVDGISERAAKGELRTTTDKAATAISFLEEVGIPSQQVCNMASRVPRILGLSTEQLQAVVAYLKHKGLGGVEVQGVLERHPKLLLFSPSGDVLALDRMRAQVGKDGSGRVGVQMYREGAYLKGAILKQGSGSS